MSCASSRSARSGLTHKGSVSKWKRSLFVSPRRSICRGRCLEIPIANLPKFDIIKTKNRKVFCHEKTNNNSDCASRFSSSWLRWSASVSSNPLRRTTRSTPITTPPSPPSRAPRSPSSKTAPPSARTPRRSRRPRRHARRRLRALFRRRPHGRRRLRPLLHQDPPRISPRRPPRTAAGGDRRRRVRRSEVLSDLHAKRRTSTDAHVEFKDGAYQIVPETQEAKLTTRRSPPRSLPPCQRKPCRICAELQPNRRRQRSSSMKHYT